MKRHSRVTFAVGLVAAAVTVVAGCTSSKGSKTSSPSAPQGVQAAFNASYDKIVNPSTKTGGTLNLLSSSDVDNLDPQRTYYGWSWNLQRLFTRSLIGYKVLNGQKFELAPDLATDMGTHNADFTTWTYTLK